ncbi:hypothetical protein B0O99DRAFT_166655 [Bisporella sp. PMI_857]|nr:hypothetical protein B0O99DRAFT_166655 [Bisporella sp. PMI_857]
MREQSALLAFQECLNLRHLTGDQKSASGILFLANCRISIRLPDGNVLTKASHSRHPIVQTGRSQWVSPKHKGILKILIIKVIACTGWSLSQRLSLYPISTWKEEKKNNPPKNHDIMATHSLGSLFRISKSYKQFFSICSPELWNWRGCYFVGLMIGKDCSCSL